MNKIVAIVKLTRIEHSVMLIVAVLAAELIVGGLPVWPILILSFITPALISMGAFAINDYFDVETDKANKKTKRPIVSGAISKKQAYWIALFCLIVGPLLSLLINVQTFAIALLFSVLAYLYSYKLKDMLLIGNIYVAFSMAIPFLYGNYVVSNLIGTNIVLICFIVFLSGFAREIHGMIRDKTGDLEVRKSKNLIYYIGANKSAIFALSLYAEAIVIAYFLWFFEVPFKFNFAYLGLITISNLMLAYVASGYLVKPNKKFYDLSRNLSLAAMSIAIFAYLLAPLVPILI